MKIYSSRKHQILLLTLFSYTQILEIFIVKKDKSLNYNLFQFEIALYTSGPGRFHFQRSIKRDVVPFSRTSERKVQRKQSKITRRFHPVGPFKSQLKIITAILVVKLMRDPAANKFDECHLSTQLTAKLDRAGPPWIIPCSVKKKKKRREERERDIEHSIWNADFVHYFFFFPSSFFIHLLVSNGKNTEALLAFVTEFRLWRIKMTICLEMNYDF